VLSANTLERLEAALKQERTRVPESLENGNPGHDETSGALATLARSHPLSGRLIRHSLAAMEPDAVAALLAAYAAEPPAYFDRLEREIGLAGQAAGRDLNACLADLDQFNTLTPETENDAWYDRVAAFTSMHLDALLIGFSRRRLDRLLEHAAALRLDQATALEVGSGCGLLAADLLEQETSWQAILVDRSSAAVSYSRRYLAGRGLADRAFVQPGDLAAISAPDNSADLVIAAEVLEHAEDPDRSLAELQRVLKPGGCLLISLPIDLDIGMHPTFFSTEQEILSFFGERFFVPLRVETVRPDPQLDSIARVFPEFAGCLHATFVNEQRGG